MSPNTSSGAYEPNNSNKHDNENEKNLVNITNSQARGNLRKFIKKSGIKYTTFESGVEYLKGHFYYCSSYKQEYIY